MQFQQVKYLDNRSVQTHPRAVLTTLVRSVVMTICGLLVGCATLSSGPPTADVTGIWHGSWSFSPGSAASGTGALTFVLQQSGAEVTGEVTNEAFPQGTGPLRGTVRGNTLEFSDRSPSGGGWLAIRGNEMHGRTRTGYSVLYFKRER